MEDLVNLGYMTTPVIIVDDEVIVGFDQKRLDQLLGIPQNSLETFVSPAPGALIMTFQAPSNASCTRMRTCFSRKPRAPSCALVKQNTAEVNQFPFRQRND